MKTEILPLTREEFYVSDRGERAYYESKKSLKEPLRLPLTVDGCNTILEIVGKVLDLEIDDMMIAVFCGWIHHMPQTTRHFTMGDAIALIHNHMSKSVTWKIDQDAKEHAHKAKEAEAAKTTLTLAKDTADESKADEGPRVQ